MYSMIFILHFIYLFTYFSALFQAEGYNDGELILYHTFSVTEFLKAENPVDFLSKANAVRFQTTTLIFQTSEHMFVTSNFHLFLLQITFDNPELESHPITSPEIRECCCDIKVLGRKELRWVTALVDHIWRVSVRSRNLIGCCVVSLLLSWRSKLRRFLAKKLRQEAKHLDQEMRCVIIIIIIEFIYRRLRFS